MPVISVDPEKLLEMTDTDQFELIDALPKLGIDIEKMTDEAWDLEIFPDRCDNLSIEGLSRTIKGFIGKETGLPEYQVNDSDIETEVELSVQDVRPYIVTAIVKDIEITEDFLKSLMDVQEKLHMTLGRRREKVAIGLHDLDKIQPPFTYKAVSPHDISFTPLQRTHEMDLQDILEKHKKGQEYAHILEDFDRYPIIIDSNEDVLSFPPIINGVLTEVNEDTENIFIDMTGTDEKILDQTLNILATMFAERGSEIYTTKVRYGKKEKVYPKMDIEKIGISSLEVEEILGVELDDEQIIDILTRMRYNSYIKGDEIEVEIPPYRHDIHHPWDVIEDIAIGFGLDKFQGEKPRKFVVGKPHKIDKLSDALVEILLGYGFQEVVNFTLSNPKREYANMEIDDKRGMAKIENPVTEEHTGLRVHLLPTLLDNLRSNRNKSLPQKLFEVGDVVKNSEQFSKVGGVMIHSEAGFTEIKSLMEGLAVNLGLDIDIDPIDHDSFIEGRCASIIIKGEEIGYFGEIHPKVLENFELEYPTTGFELDVDILYKMLNPSKMV